MVGNWQASMKCTVKITSRGRITVPAEVLRGLGVRKGDSVVFEKNGDEVWVLRKRSGRSPFVTYRGIGNPRLPSGREAVLNYLREASGRDADEEEWEQAHELSLRKKNQADEWSGFSSGILTSSTLAARGFYHH